LQSHIDARNQGGLPLEHLRPARNVALSGRRTDVDDDQHRRQPAWGFRFGMLGVWMWSGSQSPVQQPARQRGCYKKVMMRIDCCSPGIHAAAPHLVGGDLAGTIWGDQLAPARR
jgi:hypothetical protein